MSQAQLQFVRAAGPSSWLIARFGVQAPGFSHVDIVLSDGRLLGARDDHAGGEPPGVRIRPANYGNWVRREVVSFNVPLHRQQNALTWGLREVGQKYDEDAILGFIFGQRWHMNGAFICSVLAGGFLLRAGILHEKPEDLQGTSPNTLYSICLAEGATKAA